MENTVKISNEQRLVTLTEEAYNRLNEDLISFRRTVESRTIIIRQKVELFEDPLLDKDRWQHRFNFASGRAYGMEETKYEIGNNGDQTKLLIDIRAILEHARTDIQNTHLKIDNRVFDLRYEAQKAAKTLNDENNNPIARTHAFELKVASLPFFVKWFVKFK